MAELRAPRPHDPRALAELAPDGTVRVAIALSPAPSPFFATTDPATGAPRGVTVDLAAALGEWLGLPRRLVRFPNSGEITERARHDEWDVTFMPQDAERAKRVDFGPAYALVESTFLVAPGSGIGSYAEVDRAGVRVAAIDNTATARSAARFLRQAALVPFAKVDDVLAAVRGGGVDAVALSRDSLASLAERLPGARLLDGRFHAAGVAVAVPPGRTAALALVSRFVEQAKASGLVRRALDAAALKHATVAPPA